MAYGTAEPSYLVISKVTFVQAAHATLIVLCYTVYDAIGRFARHAVVPLTRFISAFLARRLFSAPNLKLIVSGIKADHHVCLSV